MFVVFGMILKLGLPMNPLDGIDRPSSVRAFAVNDAIALNAARRPKMGLFRAGKARIADSRITVVGLSDRRSLKILGTAPTSSKQDRSVSRGRQISPSLDIESEDFPPIWSEYLSGFSGKETEAIPFGLRSASVPRRSGPCRSTVTGVPTVSMPNAGLHAPELGNSSCLRLGPHDGGKATPMMSLPDVHIL